MNFTPSDFSERGAPDRTACPRTCEFQARPSIACTSLAEAAPQPRAKVAAAATMPRRAPSPPRRAAAAPRSRAVSAKARGSPTGKKGGLAPRRQLERRLRRALRLATRARLLLPPLAHGGEVRHCLIVELSRLRCHCRCRREVGSRARASWSALPRAFAAAGTGISEQQQSASSSAFVNTDLSVLVMWLPCALQAAECVAEPLRQQEK